MKKQVLAILACAASMSFAQTVVSSLDVKISCRESFNEVANVQRDAATARLYAIVDTRIRALEEVPKKERQGKQYEDDKKLCDLSVKLYRMQLEHAALIQKYIEAQREVAQVKDSLINALDSQLGSERERMERMNLDSKKALAEKDYQLNKIKEEADKKLEALRSKTISVYKDARGTILSMSDILFETGKAELKQELKENLAEIAGILKNLLTDATVIVEGHTDNVGKADANLKLSQQRAGEVVKYLTGRGVDKKRLKSVGYGMTKPVADNATDEGKAKNRRVELVIKDK
ncbi:MAG: OmpA family protein [Fibromonadales bacterium]|nr:OmpA family protein [Fibromonadales bacterium]